MHSGTYYAHKYITQLADTSAKLLLLGMKAQTFEQKGIWMPVRKITDVATLIEQSGSRLPDPFFCNIAC